MIEEESYTRCNEHILKNDSNFQQKKNKNEQVINNKFLLDNSNPRISLIRGDAQINDNEDVLILSSNEFDNITKEEKETKDDTSPLNEWITHSIPYKQAKLGNFFTNIFSRNIKIIEYAPEIFRNILRFDRIDENQLVKSFNVTDNILKLSSFKGSEGKSGSIFFETHDKKFIIKTISEGELKSMINNLIKKYYTLFSGNVYSNLTRIYGLYTLILGMSKVHVVVMENIFPFDMLRNYLKLEK